MLILDGRFGADFGKGNYSCHKPHGESTFDYILVSPFLMSRIGDFQGGCHDACLSDVESPVEVTIKNCAGTVAIFAICLIRLLLLI